MFYFYSLLSQPKVLSFFSFRPIVFVEYLLYSRMPITGSVRNNANLIGIIIKSKTEEIVQFRLYYDF